MSKLFNWAAARIVAAFAFALPLAAMAVTPVAVWDGASEDYNFSELTRNGYTLGQIGGDFANTVAADGSYLQIAPNNTDAAITLKKSDSSNMGASTVIIKVEDIPADGGANRAMLSFLKLGSFNNNEYTAEFPFIGVAEEKNRTRTSSFIWNNEIWNDSRNVRTDNAFSAGSHTVALAYSYAAGAAFYVDGVQRGASADLRSSGYNPLGVAIGGIADTRTSNKFYSMTGMKVTAVAFFDSKISDSDIANYVFPSDEGSVWTATVSSDTAWADIVWNKAWESDMSGATVQLTIESGATVTAPASLTVGNLSVSGAGTLTFAAGENTLSGTASIGTKVTLANGVTLKTSGVVGLTSSANDFSGGSLLDVVSGSTSVNAKECGLSGDITVESGATLVNLRSSDALNYDANPVTTVRVYGTLDFGTTRWSTRGVAKNCYYFYDGAVVKGAGQSSNGALDFIENSTGGAINIEGSVTISAAIRVRGGANVALVNANAATLAFSSTINGDGTFSKAGAGTLTFSGVPTLSTLTVSEGTLAFTTASDVTMTTKYTAKPDSANMAYTQQSNWKGTVLADWVGATDTRFDINSYGNANSVVEVTQLAGGWASTSGADFTVVPTVKVSGTMTLDNGYGSYITTFTKLTGSGTVTFKTKYCDINVLDKFTGTLNLQVSSKIYTINLATAPSVGDKIVTLATGSAAQLWEFDQTEVSVNGVVDNTIKIAAKTDGIYVVPETVTITVPAVEHATVSVTAGGSAVEPTSPGANTYEVDYGAEVVVTYAVDDDAYELVNGTIELTATESTEVTAPTVTPYVAWIYDGNNEIIGKYKQPLPAVIAFGNGTGEKARFAEALDAQYHNQLVAGCSYDAETITYTRLPTVAVIISASGVWTNKYPTIAAAVSDATVGDTITLVGDVTLAESVEVAAGKSVTIDLDGNTITGPASGYAFSNAGEITIENGTVTGAGGVAENTANGASIAVSSGSYTATGDLFGNVEGGTIAVSGGTFNKSVADEYVAEGYEVTDNGDGTYGIRDYLGWIYEAYDHPGYTGGWTKDVTYDEITHKVHIEDGNTYTASKPSDGQLVTVAMSLSFDDANDEDEDVGDAKAAVRLASGQDEGTYQFQLYTTNELGAAAWANATAGVTATTNVDYTFVFVLDLTNKIYTASIVDGTATNALTVGGASDIPFAYQGTVTPVHKIDFIGAGTVTSIEGSYEDAEAPVEEFNPNEEVTINGASVMLTSDQADWLNACSGSKAEKGAVLGGLGVAAFNNAYLLNLDITDPAYDGTFTFKVTDFTVGDATVSVTVTLTRKGKLDGGINGTLKLTGTADLDTDFADISVTPVGDDDFSGGDTATWTFDKGSVKFFQPVIE